MYNTHDASFFLSTRPDPQTVSKYAESEVNIHYRAPIRTEVRDLATLTFDISVNTPVTMML